MEVAYREIALLNIKVAEKIFSMPTCLCPDGRFNMNSKKLDLNS